MQLSYLKPWNNDQIVSVEREESIKKPIRG